MAVESNLFDRLRSAFMQGSSMVRKLILINVSVFVAVFSVRTLLSMGGAEAAFETYIFRNLAMPVNIGGLLARPWTIVSYMFMHGGFMHILFNMLMLFWMGSNFQDYLGNRRLLAAYMWGGLAGGLLVVLAYATLPMLAGHQTAVLVGASASVYAVVCGMATLIPNYEVALFGLWFVRLKWLAGIMVLLSFFDISSQNPGGNIAHLGGAAFGFLYIKAIYNRGKLLSWFRNLLSRPVVKKYRPKMKVYERGNTFVPPSARTRPSQEEIDLILDKISASGYESLSSHEKEVLFKASKEE